VAHGRLGVFAIWSNAPFVPHTATLSRRGEVQWHCLHESGEAVNEMLVWRGRPKLGFYWHEFTMPPTLRSRGNFYAAPCWSLIAAAAAAPGARLVQMRWRRRRAARGRCRACGYDLAGNASGVCSECGAGRT
jgi:hypothetical protein